MKEFETDHEDFKQGRKEKIEQDYEKDFIKKQDKFASKRRKSVEPYKRERINPNNLLDEDYYDYME